MSQFWAEQRKRYAIINIVDDAIVGVAVRRTANSLFYTGEVPPDRPLNPAATTDVDRSCYRYEQKG